MLNNLLYPTVSEKSSVSNLHFLFWFVLPTLQLNVNKGTLATLKGPFAFVGLSSVVEQIISVSPAYNVHNVGISVPSVKETKLNLLLNTPE